MTKNEFLSALDNLIAEKHLLKHPFYQLWSQGKLTRENLREYAISYYPHVAAFPTLRLGRALGLRGRGAAPGAAREPDRGGARHGEPSRAVAAVRGRARRGCVGARRGAADARGGRHDRGVPPRDARRLGGRGPRGPLRVRVADPRGLEDQARGPRPPSTASSTRMRRASSRCTRRPTCGTGRSSGRRSGASPTRPRRGRRPWRRRGAAATRSTGRSTA